MHRGEGGHHTPVALIGDQAQRPRLGYTEIDAGHPDGGGQKDLPQRLARRPGEITHLGGHLQPQFAQERLGHCLSAQMQRRSEDVAGRFVTQLDNVFAQIGLNGLDPDLLQRRIEADLLGQHRLGLGHPGGTAPLGDVHHDLTGFFGGGGLVHLHAPLAQPLREESQVRIQPVQRHLADGARMLAQVLDVVQSCPGLPSGPLPTLGVAIQRALQRRIAQGAVGAVEEGLPHRSPGSLEVRTCARWAQRTAEPRRRSPPSRCMRQLTSQPTTASTPAESISSSLRLSMASEISA